MNFAPQKLCLLGAALTLGATVLSGCGGSCDTRSALAQAHQEECLKRIRQLNNGLSMYRQDWNDHFPLAESWGDNLFLYTKSN